MKYRGYNAKVDANHAEIKSALERMGCSVEAISKKGVPDLLIGIDGFNLLAEVKDGSKPPSGRKLTPDQEKWHSLWRGQVCILKSVDDAVGLVNAVRGGHKYD